MDRALKLAAALGLVLVLPGCWPFTPAPIATGVTRHLPCSVGPVILHHGDQLTDATGREIVALNETGAALCGWTPPKH